MKRILLVAALSAIAFVSCDDDDDDNVGNQVNSTDSDFALRANMGNYAEIQGGQLAVTKATAADVKSFGQQMVTDHTTAKTQLMDIADDLNIHTRDSLDAANMALNTQLGTLAGRAFDSVYIHSQVMMHTQTISLFQNEINSGVNTRLRNYASQQLPHLQAHLQSAQTIAANY
jgi:putative membrane protein